MEKGNFRLFVPLRGNNPLMSIKHPEVSDMDAVIGIIREAATVEIMPRFRRLGEGEISEKRPGDLVTKADLEEERH